jgi:hypothetical protein
VEALAQALADAGGIAAPRERGGRLRTLLAAELERGTAELARARSGYPEPVIVAIAAAPAEGGLIGVAPVAPALRADPDAVPERAWLLTAALVGALVEAGAGAELEAGHLGHGALALRLRGDGDGADAELAALAFEEQVAPVDRLRAGALALPAHVLADATGFKPPIGAAHPLLIAAHVARLGGVPADPRSTEEHEDAVLALLESEAPAVSRPHDDPEPARRVARRILQRLDGMGKWGGYHTEFAHLARGFAGNDRALAEAVGEALLASGLLSEKPSVGQRHVFLNPRRAGAIHALIERGDVPEELVLP